MDAQETHQAAVAGRLSARERILDTSYGLFARRGIRAVGVDEILARSGVAKATFYRHFKSKDDLVLAYMDRWYNARSSAIEAAIRSIENCEEAVLAVFGVLDDWFQHDAVEVSTFLHVMIEMGPEHPLGRASIGYLERTREQLVALARAADLADPEGFAWSCHILIKGAMVADMEGDRLAAERARTMATLLLEHHKRAGLRPRKFQTLEEATRS